MNRKVADKAAPTLIGAATAPVAVGLPVYNGEPYLAAALASLLAQRDVDFELWIGDNCSTDGTEELCREAARHDDRIRYRRRERNIGPTANHNRLVHEARSRYFTWAASDDAYEPDRLHKMVAALADRPDAVLAFTSARQIDSGGRTVGHWHNPCRTDHVDPVVRIRDLIGLEHENYHCYGLYLRDVLTKTHLLPPVKNNDRILIAELALYGRFVEVREELLLHRLHEQRLTQSVSARDWYRTQRTDGRRLVLPNVEEAGWYLRAIAGAPLRRQDRVLALLALRPWVRENAAPMARNVARAALDGARMAASASGRLLGK
ncbi:glycosyltransferase family A protein [Kutzneria buriramensis]|uniref:Glycosyl transferase family 2 n=1 Tax=Kutzneria buriramensis TaxID=1045776 RepID=A0A3E0I958_9PSEU|nr:glycosyltransferase family A protein [Kutzneria buriramensis]REH55273.1 glycosyl transferase family 2 [Kutzneria buriramensis]